MGRLRLGITTADDLHLYVDNIEVKKEHIVRLDDQNYLWDDITTDLSAGKTAGANVPTWSNIRDGLYGYKFGVGDEVFCAIHLNHDILEGSELLVHCHWLTNSASPSGNVRWGFEYSIAKGHQQTSGSDYPASTTIYAQQAVTDQYRHMVAEVAQGGGIPGTNVEPDALVLLRVFRAAATSSESTDNIFGLTVDIHYQKAKLGTKNRTPDFNS